MFIPLRSKQDLLGPDNSYWPKFKWELDNKFGFFKAKGISILHNVQSSLSAQKLKRLPDNACAKTIQSSSTNDDNGNDDNIGHIVILKEIKRKDQIS
eukprot:3328018-Ditylum_brightwellii.AAC.1